MTGRRATPNLVEWLEKGRGGLASWELLLVILPTPRLTRRPAGSPRPSPPPVSPEPFLSHPPTRALLIASAGLESPAKNVTQRRMGEEEAAGPAAGVGAE